MGLSSTSSRCLRVTYVANPTSFGILSAVCMAARTVCLIGILGCYALTAQDVDSLCRWLQVVRIDAASVRASLPSATFLRVALMVQWQSIWNRSLELFVGNTMRLFALVHDAYDSVAILVEFALPEPATGNRVDQNVLQELVLDRYASTCPSILHSLLSLYGELSSWHNPLCGLYMAMASARSTI